MILPLDTILSIGAWSFLSGAGDREMSRAAAGIGAGPVMARIGPAERLLPEITRSTVVLGLAPPLLAMRFEDDGRPTAVQLSGMVPLFVL